MSGLCGKQHGGCAGLCGVCESRVMGRIRVSEAGNTMGVGEETERETERERERERREGERQQEMRGETTRR